ncbi:MAG: E3 binding domain-containing protein, partial [Armatimonadota bacterium]|nr:E3 binding domain-containing protein [Armatimonadota bacterium]
MPVEIRVPQMGESVTEATILRWLKKGGETVTAGEAVAELETDKVNVEVPADTGGVIQSFAHAEGDTVAVGDVLAVVGEGVPAAAAPAAPVAALPASSGIEAVAPPASPLALALAEDNKVDLGRVKGTGPGGRITKEDVTSFIENG